MVAHFLIDYPEARCIADYLHSTRGVEINEVWPHFGWHPNTDVASLRPVPDQPFFVINGSGNYHHETYAIMEGLCRRCSCAYVHIDAHPDKDTSFRWKLDCASFVGGILEIPQVSEGVLLGLHVTPDLYDLPGQILGNDINYYRFDYFKKLRQYYARPVDLAEVHFRYRRHDGILARRNASVRYARSERLRKNPSKKNRGLLVRWRDLSDFDAASIKHQQVYITVDLDVLRDAVVTDWRRQDGDESESANDNHGDLSLPELLTVLEHIGAHKQVIGADICGLTEYFAHLPADLLQQNLDNIGQVYDVINKMLVSATA